MTIIILVLVLVLVLVLAYVIFLYKNTKSTFFSQSRDVLADKRQLLIKVLEDFEIDLEKDKRWLRAFDSFRDLPSIFQYDGATIVKDLHTINGYDASAGNHDLWYIENKNLPFFKWVVEKIKADYQYGVDMRLLKIDYLTAWRRVIALWLSTFIYPLTKIKL